MLLFVELLAVVEKQRSGVRAENVRAYGNAAAAVGSSAVSGRRLVTMERVEVSERVCSARMLRAQYERSMVEADNEWNTETV